ncbi:hypothetical protein PIB30_097926 [Stylosanthes scabra]|uniref:Retrotransposon gag domain-containing protein n=1 Tax=Stylosanthes scabra TaxID=79078 RepID=A0ABU6RWN0_9FABA|nr:hypothetical protein [Stylosanthes scabra]
MAESSSTRSGENRPPRRRSVTPRNLNLNMETSQGEDGHHDEEKEHMERQNMGVGGGGTPAQGNFFTPYVGCTAGVHTHITIPAHVYNHMMENQARMQTFITEMMTKDQTRYRTPSPPPAMNQEGMEEDENTPITRRELARILKGRAFTWYAKLRHNSINAWEQLIMEFCNKFLEEEPSMHIMDLGRISRDKEKDWWHLSKDTETKHYFAWTPCQSHNWCTDALEMWKMGPKFTFL